MEGEIPVLGSEVAKFALEELVGKAIITTHATLSGMIRL